MQTDESINKGYQQLFRELPFLLAAVLKDEFTTWGDISITGKSKLLMGVDVATTTDSLGNYYSWDEPSELPKLSKLSTQEFARLFAANFESF